MLLEVTIAKSANYAKRHLWTWQICDLDTGQIIDRGEAKTQDLASRDSYYNRGVLLRDAGIDLDEHRDRYVAYQTAEYEQYLVAQCAPLAESTNT